MSKQHELVRAPAWRKYAEAARTALQNLLAFPLEFAAPLVSYGLFVFIFTRIWATAFANTNLIAGYTQSMCTWYFIVAELCIFATGAVFFNLARDVRDGQIAYSIARPYHFVAFQFAHRAGPALVQGLGYAIVGMVIGALSVGFVLPINPLHLLLTIISVIVAVSTQILLQTAIALSAMWLEENSALFWIWQKLALVLGTLMPLEFLPESWQAVVIWTPFPWLSWSPGWIAVHDDAFRSVCMIGIQLLWLVFAAVLASVIFARGARKCAIQGG